MRNQFKISTDAEYVQALRALWQYAELKGSIAAADGDRVVANMWISQRENVGDSFRSCLSGMMDAEGRAEHRRGGPDLLLDEQESSDPLDDFNYVGSRHHY